MTLCMPTEHRRHDIVLDDEDGSYYDEGEYDEDGVENIVFRTRTIRQMRSATGMDDSCDTSLPNSYHQADQNKSSQPGKRAPVRERQEWQE